MVKTTERVETMVLVFPVAHELHDVEAEVEVVPTVHDEQIIVEPDAVALVPAGHSLQVLSVA